MTAAPRQDGLLVVEFQGDIVRTIPLTFDVLRIGRAPDNDLALQHPAVSRRHVELSLTPAGLVATDLESINGTFVDGVQVLANQPTPFEPGQTLQVGPFIFVVRRSPADRPDGVRPVASLANGGLPESVARGPIDQYLTVAPTYPRRPTLPVPAPSGQRSKYLDYLPTVFAENDFLGRYLLIFESIWEALEQRQDHIAMYFDPGTCPEPLLPWLAGWFDLETGFHWPEARKRDLIDQVADLYRYRGTAYGLTKMLEIWTGTTAEISEDPTQPFVFRVRLKVPPGGQVDRSQVEDLLQTHKPAAAGYVLEIESREARHG
jgi:phage tail-like protein